MLCNTFQNSIGLLQTQLSDVRAAYSRIATRTESLTAENQAQILTVQLNNSNLQLQAQVAEQQVWYYLLSF